MFVAVMTEIAKFLQIKMDIYGAVFSFWDFMLWTLVSRAGRLGSKGDAVVMSDNFNKFCGVLILLLLGLSTLFTLRASAEDYTPPAEDSTETVTDSEETHEVVQVQGVQTYDPTAV